MRFTAGCEEKREWKQANLAPDKTAWFQAHFLTYLCLLLYAAEIQEKEEIG